MLSLLFSRTMSALWQIYPDLASLRDAVVKCDWAAVAGHFGRYPAGFDATTAVSMVGQLKGAEKFLQRAVDAQRDDPLPRLLLGARYIELGWEARSGYFSQYVSREQFAVFHDYLQHAERLLATVTADEPGNAAAWTLRLDTAKGLRFGVAEARRRYERAAAASPHPYAAQSKLIQQLCPKWSGDTFEPVHKFAVECLREAPAGAINGAVVAEAHLENAWHNGGHRIGSALLASSAHEPLREAAQRSVLHADYRPVHGWVTAHGLFAYIYWRFGHNREARPHLEAMGTNMSRYPWGNSHGRKGHAGFREARLEVLGWGRR